MKRFLLSLLVVTFPMLMAAQSVSEIKNSKEYLWGEGRGKTYKQANQQALQQVVEQICVSIESEFSHIEEEVISDGDIDSHSAVRSVMKTYSQVTLDSTMKIEISQEPDAHVLRYVKVSEKNKFFENRKTKVNDYVKFAQVAEKKGNIDEALKDYYWAYCLLTSLPNSAQMPSPEPGIHMKTWIPNQMNDIFSNIKVQKQKVDGEFVTLRITYKGAPVSRLDYTYFDGRGQSNIYSAVDGIGTMEMYPGVSTDNLKIKCEYEYEGQARLDHEVETVVEVMKGFNFNKATINVTGDDIPMLKPKPGPGQPSGGDIVTSPYANSISTLSDDEVKPYESIMNDITNAIKNKAYSSVTHYFTPEGAEMFNSLINYGQARLVSEPQLSYIKDGNEVLCRSIPMSFSFKNNKRKFVENVNFTFDNNKKIRCVAFGLEKTASEDILKRSDYSEKARVVLTEFLENYKTAFALKRLDYLSEIFDDNALIITGTVVKKTNYQSKEERTRYLDNQIIKYNRFSKTEYIQHLQHSFKSKEYINIRFADNDIVKAGGDYGEVYGIQIRQDYYSDNYGDSGYLFIMVDLNNPDMPVIKVRTWQPDKDPNFGWYDMGVF